MSFIASPTPKLNFTDEREMIDPAVNGVLYVLKTARDAKVKRVVLTSAYGAIFAGHENRTTPYTEKDWSNLESKNIFPIKNQKRCLNGQHGSLLKKKETAWS